MNRFANSNKFNRLFSLFCDIRAGHADFSDGISSHRWNYLTNTIFNGVYLVFPDFMFLSREITVEIFYASPTFEFACDPERSPAFKYRSR
jgi:hypothetical protein